MGSSELLMHVMEHTLFFFMRITAYSRVIETRIHMCCWTTRVMASVAVDLFMRFCVNTNIDYRQMRDSLRKYLLAYQQHPASWCIHRAVRGCVYELGLY